MRKFVLSLMMFFACFAYGQAPQVTVTGSLGLPGSAPILGYYNVPMTDANYTLNVNEAAHNYLKLTGTLTASRNLVLPLNNGQQYTIENATTGGFSVVAIGSSGTGFAVVNGITNIVATEGTNYIGVGGSGTLAGDVIGPLSSNIVTNIQGLSSLEYRNAPNPNLQVFERALANCQNQAVNVVWIGDSTTVVYAGDGSSEGPANANDRFAEQERLYLQNRCGSHGTGIVPYIKFLINGVSLPNSQYYGPSSGTLSQDATLGPYHNFGSGNQGVLTSAQSGAVMNWTSDLVNLPENSANVYCLTGPSYGIWSIVVNAHGTTTPNLATGSCGGNSTSPAMSVVNVSGWTSQIVDVHITCSATPCKMWGIEGVNGTTGVSVHNVGAASGFAEDYAVTNGLATTDSIANQTMFHVNFGTNEALTSVSSTVFQAAMNTIVVHEKALSSPPSILLYQYPICNATGCSNLASMSTASIAVAQANQVGIISMVDAWSGQVIPSAFDSDNIHPSNLGGLASWERIKAAEIDSEATISSGNTSNPTCAANAIPYYASSGTVFSCSTGIGINAANNTILQATATASGTPAGYKLTVAGTNDVTLVSFATGSSSGLAGAPGFYDSTTSHFIWNTNTADDLYGYTPLTNVAAGTGAAWSILHTGVATFSGLNVPSINTTSTSTYTSSGLTPVLNLTTTATPTSENSFVGLGIVASNATTTGVGVAMNFGLDLTNAYNQAAFGWGNWGGSGSSSNYAFVGVNNGSNGQGFCSTGTGATYFNMLYGSQCNLANAKSGTDANGNWAMASAKLAVYTVSTLPSASSLAAGTQVIVSDATTFTPGTCTGGGSDYMVAVTNGSAWSCH